MLFSDDGTDYLIRQIANGIIENFLNPRRYPNDDIDIANMFPDPPITFHNRRDFDHTRK